MRKLTQLPVHTVCFASVFCVAMCASIAGAQLTIAQPERRVFASCGATGRNGCQDGGRLERTADGFSTFRDSVEVHTRDCSGASGYSWQTSSFSSSVIQFSGYSSVGTSSGDVWQSGANGESIARVQIHLGALLDYELDAEGAIDGGNDSPWPPYCAAILEHPDGTVEGFELGTAGSSAVHHRGTLASGDYHLILRIALQQESFGGGGSSSGRLDVQFKVSASTAVQAMRWQQVKMLYRDAH
jgi:hypothetical protein